MAACVRKVYDSAKNSIQLGWKPLDIEALGFSLPCLWVKLTLYVNLCNIPITNNRQRINVSDYKSDRPYYIGEHLGHLKDLEISKYKRESNGRMSMKSYRFIFVICYIIWLSKY